MKSNHPQNSGASAFVQSQVRFITKHALAIVVITALATLAVMPLVSRLKLRANFMELLPQDYPSIKNLKELSSHVGGTSFLIAVVESPDEETARLAAKEFSRRAASFQQIEYVDNRTNAPLFERNKLLFLKLESLQALKAKVRDVMGYYRRKANPMFVDLLDEKPPVFDPALLELEQRVYKIGGFSAKEDHTFMQILLLKPKHPLSNFVLSRQMFDEAFASFDEIKKGFKQPVKLGLTGSYRTRFQEYVTIQHDLQLTGILTMVFLVLINLFAFRNFRSLVYAYLPLAVGVIWTWAFTQVTIGYLNLITAFLAAILFGMGGDYTFHILTSFEDDLRESGNVEKAIEMTYHELWHPLWSSMSTTAVVFYAMIITKFEGFRHFGIIAGVGIAISFVIVLYLQPSLILLIERYFPLQRKPEAARKQVSKKLIQAVVIVGLLFSVYSLFQIPHVKFNYNFGDLQSKHEDAIKLADRVGTHFNVRLNPVVFMTPSRAKAAALAEQINRYVSQTPGTLIDFSAALSSHVPGRQQEKIQVLKEIGLLLKNKEALIRKLDPEMKKKIEDLKSHLEPRPFGIDDLPAGLHGQYEGTDRKISAVFVYPNVRILDGALGKKFVKEVRAFPAPADATLAGEPVIYADILNLIDRDVPVALVISTVVVFLLVLWHFKRLDHALWVHVPFLVGVLWMLGMMSLFKVRFNFFNMVIVPSILGVGIDNGIYIFDRYKQRRNENFFESMHKSLKGVMLASATNIAAFASLMFAEHNGMASIGYAGFYGFLSCLLASVLFVPALIEWSEFKYAHLFRREEEEKGKQPV